jgi:acetylornithine deacetylase/succinyl-diaminopimelate desuccinylase-like protein
VDRLHADLQNVRAYLEQGLDRHLKRLQTLLRQPSVSITGEGCEACARLYADLSRDAGFPEVELIQTPGFPGVWAAYDVGAPVTCVIYGMLDVRLAAPAGWTVPPFSAEVLELEPFGRVVVARGAHAVKGPIGVFLNAIEACKRVLGAPPVNVLMISEVDEILGSPHYRAMVTKYRDRIKGAQAAWTPGAAQDATGAAGLTLGYKGLIYMFLRASGAKWGRGPKTAPIHGMAKSVVDSPAWRLVQALATLTGPDGNTVLVDGFDRGPDAPTADEAAEVEALMKRFKGTPWQKVLPGVQGADVPAVNDMSEAEVYRHFFFGPSMNLQGLRSGYVGGSSPTFTLPSVAEASFDIRVPRSWKTQDVLRGMRARLDAKGFADVEMDVKGAYDGSSVPRDSLPVRAAHEMYRARGVEVVNWPMTGGGGPWSMFSNDFGIPLLRGVGMGGGRGSATDEFLAVDGNDKVAGMVEMATSHVEYMMRLAALGAR